jgi:hypothetical protein
MAKKAVSITLDESNLLWLKGRARVLAGGSLSEAIDQLIDEARAGTLGAVEAPRSIVGTIDVPDDAVLVAAADDVRGMFHTSLSRPVALRHKLPAAAAAKPKRRK